MIDINEVAHFVEQKANELSSQKQYNILFRAKSYASFLDSRIDDELLNKEFTPIYIDNASGNYEAIPNLRKSSQSCDISIIFEASKKYQYIKFLSEFSSLFSGETLSVGSITAICNSSLPIFSQVEPMNFTQFNDFMQANFKSAMKVTSHYIIARITLYLTSVENNAYLFSNKVKFKLSFDYENEHYEDDITYYQASNGMSNNPISQQLIGDDYASSINNITNYAKSIACYIKDNAFWLKFIELYNSRKLNEATNVKLIKSYSINNAEIEIEQIILSVNENINIGDLLSFSISFIDKGSI